MNALILCDADPSHYDAIVALNQSVVSLTSPMDRARLARLAALSVYFRVVVQDSECLGFLLAMRQDAPYDNPNFSWFKGRFDRYWYIDRVVVDHRHRGRHLGSRLYADVLAQAQQDSAQALTCEYNLIPANPASAHFHHHWGFRALGDQWLQGHSKQVSLQARPIEVPSN